MKPFLTAAAILLALASAGAPALQPAPGVPFAATGTIEYGFTPDDHIDDMIIPAIDAASRQILVQAFSLTYRRIADALVRARSRGVEVAVIADHEQVLANKASLVRDLAGTGMPVLHDSQHAASHNKVMVIAAARPDCAVVTGSYNFTFAAQHRNAENALILRGNPPLCAVFHDNWLRHRSHSAPQHR